MEPETIAQILYLILVVISAAFMGATSVALIARGRGWTIAPGRWSTSSGQIFVLTRWYGFRIFGWYPFANVSFRYWVRAPQYREGIDHELEVRQLEIASLNLYGNPQQPLSRVYQQGILAGMDIARAQVMRREERIESPDAVYATVETELLGRLMTASRQRGRDHFQLHRAGNIDDHNNMQY